MAICSFGPIVDGARGSIGGVTFSRAGSGPTLRSRPRPPFPRASRQLVAQTSLRQVTGCWPPLSVANKLAWSDHAASITLTDSLGRTYHPTGQQVFLWFNMVRLATHTHSVISTAPTDLGLATPPALVFDYNAHNIRLFSSTPAITGAMWLYMRIFALSRRRKYPYTRIFNTSDFDEPDQTPYIIATNIDAGFTPGILARAHIDWCFCDLDKRQTTKQLIYVDFTST